MEDEFAALEAPVAVSVFFPIFVPTTRNLWAEMLRTSDRLDGVEVKSEIQTICFL